jgi:hypothetical protein
MIFSKTLILLITPLSAKAPRLSVMAGIALFLKYWLKPSKKAFAAI